jgi:hypothetical protein
MVELGDCASITKLRRASKKEFDVHGMLASINMLLIRSLSEFVVRRSLSAGQSMDEFVAPPNVCFCCKQKCREQAAIVASRQKLNLFRAALMPCV